jgi:hypothetical protein
LARTTKNLTLSPETADYLKNFPNQSKIVDEAIELHRNKDKFIERPKTIEVKNVRIRP